MKFGLQICIATKGLETGSFRSLYGLKNYLEIGF